MAHWKRHTHKVSAAAALILIAGCAQHPAMTPDQRLQNQASQDAQQAHRDLNQAGKEAQKALVEARRETGDIVAGARQGWKQGSPADRTGLIDLNHASVSDLETLPGVSAATARRIVAHRPYSTADGVQTQGVVSDAEWRRIAGHVQAE